MLALLLLAAAIQFDGGVFRITGWEAAGEPPSGWSSVFSVYAGSGDVPPLRVIRGAPANVETPTFINSRLAFDTKRDELLVAS